MANKWAVLDSFLNWWSSFVQENPNWAQEFPVIILLTMAFCKGAQIEAELDKAEVAGGPILLPVIDGIVRANRTYKN